MKWVTFPEHKPPLAPLVNNTISQEVFFRDKHNNLYVGFTDSNYNFMSNSDYIDDVTHFCVPDPVEEIT